jgi:hypothetical protein
MLATYQRLGVTIYDSNRAVIKAARRKLKRKYRFARKYRHARFAFYREMMRHHKDECRLAGYFHL